MYKICTAICPRLSNTKTINLSDQYNDYECQFITPFNIIRDGQIIVIKHAQLRVCPHYKTVIKENLRRPTI